MQKERDAFNLRVKELEERFRKEQEEKTAAQDPDEVSNQGKETLEESRISEKKVTEEKQATKDKEPRTQEEPADRVQTGDKQDKTPEIPWKKSKS